MHLGANVPWSFDGVKFQDVLRSVTKFCPQFLDVSGKLSGSIPWNGNPRINEEFRIIRVYVNLVGIKQIQ